MKTSAERQAEFLADLRALLRKHGAEFYVEDRSCGYYTEGVASIEIPAIFDTKECVAEGSYFDLPGYLTGEEPTK